jgi:uncharacterized protein YecT (DUF1311 family)
MLILLFFSVNLLSAENKLKNSRPADLCAKSASESSLLACRRKEFDDSENKVNEKYNKLINNYKKDEPNIVSLLEMGKTTWLAYRDADCKLQNYFSQGGTAYNVYLLDCLTKMNKLRDAEYKKMLDNP